MDSLCEKEVSLDQLMPLIRESLAAGKTVTFLPRGISMLPMLRQGRDSVTLSAITKDLKKYDIPLYQRDNGAYVLHRIVDVGESYTCIGDNQYEWEAGLRRDQMIAVVTAFTRNGKTVPVSNVRYQAYCRLWHWSRPIRHFMMRLKRKVVRRMK